MSIQGLGGIYGPGGPLPQPQGPRGPDEAPPRDRAEAARTPPSSGREPWALDRSTGEDLPVQAPPGTDPDLWSVLTGEERRYFARAKAMGPVVYTPGRLGLAELGLQRGGRLDVRA